MTAWRLQKQEETSRPVSKKSSGETLMRWILALLVATANVAGANAQPSPVTIFEAKDIITMEPSAPHARFVAVADGVVLDVADSLEALSAWTKNRPSSVDRRFAKNTLMPGLIDPHVHPMQAAIMMNIPFVAPDDWVLPSGSYKGAQTPLQYRARLNEELGKSAASPFITWGYHHLFHGKIDRAELDNIAPNRAVVVWQRSFHDVIMNSVALKMFGLDSKAAFDAALAAVKADPAHGDFSAGLFSETSLAAAILKLRPHIMSQEKLTSGFAAMQKMMLSSGVTTVSDMGTGIFADFDTEAGVIKNAFGDANNPSRVMLMPIAGRIDESKSKWLEAITSRFSGRNIRVDRRIKLFADGAFFAQNMQMNPPGYSDGHQGKWLVEPEILNRQMKTYWDDGFSIHVHVNGDKGLDAVLAGAEALSPRGRQTITLEHLGFSTEAQNRRIARAGLLVSAQPNYVRVLGDVYAKLGLGEERSNAMNRLGSLERKGVPIGLHSDFNMAPINPLYLAWVAANRITIGGNLRGPAERLSLEKALRAITIEAAQVIGMDAIVGSITAGKKADFAVLDRDPFIGGAAKLNAVKVQGVIFEGRYVPAP